MEHDGKQIYPPSITGKGARFAPGGSVYDHAFGKSDAYTLGVEEEYMLLDGETFDLVQHIDTVLAAVAGHELETVINQELMQSVLETATPVCHTPSEVVNRRLPQLGPLLALSASSPFWRGEPTGLRSSRQMIFAAFPRSGPPPRFESYADYAEVVGQLEKTGCIADYSHIWWDIRLHPRLGTIEVRICDAVTRREHVVALVAYWQALGKLCTDHFERGEEV